MLWIFFLKSPKDLTLAFEKFRGQRKYDKNTIMRKIQASPAFQKLALCHIAFTKDTALVPVFTNPKKSKDFHFYEKRWKSKIEFHVCSEVRCYSGSTHLEQFEWPPSSFSRNYTLHLSIKWSKIALNCVSVLCLDLFCASISNIGLRVIAAPSFNAISAYERFYRNALLLDRGEIHKAMWKSNTESSPSPISHTW